MFLRYAEQYGGNSAAALSMFDAELARQGPRPNRSFSDGTALPNSFGDVHGLHDRQASDLGLSPDLAATNQRQRAKVSRSNQPVQSAISDTNPSPLRGDIRTRGDALRNEAGAAGSRFDQKAEIVDTRDGTLATKKSLLTESGKQVFEDANASVDTAKQAVKDLLRKKK